MEAGSDILIMHLCEETAPENQKFIFQEVSELSHSFLAAGLLGCREERGSKACCLASSQGVSGAQPQTEDRELRSGPWPVATLVGSHSVQRQRAFLLSSLSTPFHSFHPPTPCAEMRKGAVADAFEDGVGFKQVKQITKA